MKKIIAVSGGPDSMYLLWSMLKKEVSPKNLVVVTVNYKKRENSDFDALVVEKFCSKNKIKFHKLICSEEVYKKYSNIKNFQNQARKIRYDFFFKIADVYKSNKIVIAHNKDDFLETAIYNYKKSKNYLFYGIENSTMKKFIVERPLLNLWKHEILVECKKFNIPYAIDRSNTDTKYERNKNRILISKMSLNEKNDLYRNFLELNLKKQHYRNQAQINYYKWKSSLHSLDFFKKIDNKQNVSYLFFLDNNINVTSLKIKNFISYIMAFNNEMKVLKLNSEVRISKKSRKLLIIVA